MRPWGLFLNLFLFFGLGLGMAAAASPSDRKGAALTDRESQDEGIVPIPSGYGPVRLRSAPNRREIERGDRLIVENAAVDSRSTAVQNGRQRASTAAFWQLSFQT